MAETLKKGGNVWMQAQAGLMGYIEAEEGHKGNPRILKSSTVFNGGDYDKMRAAMCFFQTMCLKRFEPFATEECMWWGFPPAMWTASGRRADIYSRIPTAGIWAM